MRTRHSLRLAAVSGLIALALSGCATGAPPQSQASTLTVLVSKGTPLPQQTLRDFTAQTGISVRVRTVGTDLQLAQRVREGRARGDLALGLPAPNTAKLGESRHLLPYTSTNSGEGAIDFPYVRSNRLTATSYDYVCATTSAATHPRTLQDLTQSRYRGQLTLPDPRRSSAGLTFVLTANAHVDSTGSDSWQHYWQALGANSLQVSSDADPAGAVTATTPIRVLSPTRAKVPASRTIGSTCTRRTSYAGILDTATHVNQAKRFIDALLTRKAQRRLPSTGDYPVTGGTPLTAQQREVQGLWEHNGEDNTDTSVSDSEIPGMLRSWARAIGRG